MSDTYYPISTQPEQAETYLTESMAAKVKFNSLAVVSFALGITSGILALPAVITGHFALANLKRTGERGKALAVLGLVFGYLQIATITLATIVFWSVIVQNFDEWQRQFDEMQRQADLLNQISGSLDS